MTAIASTSEQPDPEPGRPARSRLHRLEVRATRHLRHDAAEARVLLHARGDRVGEQRVRRARRPRPSRRRTSRYRARGDRRSPGSSRRGLGLVAIVLPLTPRGHESPSRGTNPRSRGGCRCPGLDLLLSDPEAELHDDGGHIPRVVAGGGRSRQTRDARTGPAPRGRPPPPPGESAGTAAGPPRTTRRGVPGRRCPPSTLWGDRHAQQVAGLAVVSGGGISRRRRRRGRDEHVALVAERRELVLERAGRPRVVAEDGTLQRCDGIEVRRGGGTDDDHETRFRALGSATSGRRRYSGSGAARRRAPTYQAGQIGGARILRGNGRRERVRVERRAPSCHRLLGRDRLRPVDGGLGQRVRMRRTEPSTPPCVGHPSRP